MSADTTPGQYVFAGIRQTFLSGTSFSICILAATLLPLILALAMNFLTVVLFFVPGSLQPYVTMSLAATFGWMGTISSAHVASTAYLLLDPKEYSGVWKPW